MPTSRQRKTKKKASIQRGKYTRADVHKINAAFDKKFLEYSTYPLDQLNTILESGIEKGVYLAALQEVIKAKKKPQRTEVASEALGSPRIGDKEEDKDFSPKSTNASQEA